MTEEIEFDRLETAAAADATPPPPPSEDGRDLVLAGALLPPSEAPALRAHLAPLRNRTVLDFPREMPKAGRPKLKFEDDVEQQLNAMIGDCRFLMHEVAYRCIAQASEAAGAMEFLNGALGCAQTGAKVADSIARLRAVPLDEDRRIAIMAETNRLLEIEKGESEKQ